MKRIRPLLCTLLLAGGTGWAGTFSATFATPDITGFFINGSGTLTDNSTWYPIIATNQLVLTVSQNNLSGSFSPYDIDNLAPIQGFTANFKLRLGPGTSTPADGAAFSFGPDVDQTSVTYNEVGAGGASFAVSFHTYTSNGGPAVDVYLYGQRIAHTPFNVGDMVNSQLQDVQIQLNPNSTLNVTYRGQVVYTNLYLPNWGPTNGYFIISARTGGLNEETAIGNVSINTTLATTPVAPTIASAPQNFTTNEGSSATFGVAVNGTGPFTFQWTKNGNPITDATNETLVLPVVLYGDNNASIAVKVTNPASTITSPSATLTVIRDTTVPTVTKAVADTSFTSILITYSKPVSDTALLIGNYSVDQSVMVAGISRVDSQTVKLETSQLAQGKTFTVTINGVQDISTIPNTIAANTKVQVLTFIYLGGSGLHKKYDTISDATGWPLANLFSDPRFPSTPDRVDIESAFEYPPGAAGRVAADPTRNYFDSVEGFFIAPATTNYVFYVAGADRIGLWLSTDDNPANKAEIAELNGWTNPRGWAQGQPFNNGVPAAIPSAQSDQFSATQWPNGNTISLTAGQRYYLLLVHMDPSWAGGDEYAATYKYEGEADPAPGSAPKLTANVLGYFFDPTGATLSFSEQPQSVSTVQGKTVTLSAAAGGSSAYGSTVLYQWQSAPKGSATFSDIAGAIGTSYTTPLLKLSDDGTQYRVIATLAPITETSSIATVNVTIDTTPPVLTAGAMPDAVAGTVDIGVGFNKAIDASVGQLANYSVAGGTITSLTVYTNRFTADSLNPLAMLVRQSVLLKVTGLSGNSGVLTVNNITDTIGNKLASTNIAFTVSAMQWGVVGANEMGGTNVVVPVAPNGFDIYSDGIGEWSAYDETTFAYEKVTGDFDKKLRVEYQDGSSQWARAGLIVRDVTNFGVDRATQTGSGASAPPYDGKAGRYQKIHVNPVGATLGGPGNPGNAAWEGNRRLDTGAQTTTAFNGVNAVPQYPNAWCRIKRVGQTFTIFRSDDGLNWVNVGSTTWGVDDASKTPMPDTVYVGPEFSPENGNVAAADQGTFLAAIRDYGNYTAAIAFDPQLKIGTDSTGKTTITWSSGTLMSSPTLQGTYSQVQNAVSPFVVTPTPGTTFYRVKQ